MPLPGATSARAISSRSVSSFLLRIRDTISRKSRARSSRRGRASWPRTRASGTIKKRFDSISVESTEENRRAYRDLLFTTEGAADYISGVILYDETIRQSLGRRHPFPKLLESQGVIPGIKVDMGAKDLAGAPGETDHRGPRRPARAAERVPRARRQVHEVARRDHDRPRASRASTASGRTRTRSRATRALAQEAGLVPIVEPEVLMDGDHSIERLRRHLADAARGLHRAARPDGPRSSRCC